MSEPAKHQCHKPGCDSEAKFTTRVRLLCRAPGQLPVPLSFDCTIQTCARHAEAGPVRTYLLTGNNRETMITGIMEAGFPEPDFLSLKVEFVPLSVEHAAVEAAPAPCCDRDGCSKPAKWQVKQRFRMLWQRGRGEPVIDTLTNLVVCDDCKAITNETSFRDKDTESSTRAWLNARGVSMPDMRTMQIAFEPLQGARLKPRLWVGDNGPKDQFAKS